MSRRKVATIGETTSAASLRGAALAVELAAAGVRQRVVAMTNEQASGADDEERARRRRDELARQRARINEVDGVLRELERCRVHDGHHGRDCPGWENPVVRAARRAVDETHDLVLAAVSSLQPVEGPGATPAS